MSKVTLESPREEIIAAWLERLRDPQSKQARRRLKDGDAYCCLGHLCEALGIVPDDQGRYLGQDKRLPYQVRKAVGLDTDCGDYAASDTLVGLNDRGKFSLAEIADFIESRPPGLFVDEAAS